jgi:hypothetical protein
MKLPGRPLLRPPTQGFVNPCSAKFQSLLSSKLNDPCGIGCYLEINLATDSCNALTFAYVDVSGNAASTAPGELIAVAVPLGRPVLARPHLRVIEITDQNGAA